MTWTTNPTTGGHVGPYTVPQHPRAEVMFRDGQALGLHRVVHGGVQQMFLRAVRQGTDLLVFDLRHLGGIELEADVRRLEERDRQGAVFFTLRGLYPTATACMRAIERHALARLTTELAAA